MGKHLLRKADRHTLLHLAIWLECLTLIMGFLLLALLLLA